MLVLPRLIWLAGWVRYPPPPLFPRQDRSCLIPSHLRVGQVRDRVQVGGNELTAWVLVDAQLRQDGWERGWR